MKKNDDDRPNVVYTNCKVAIHSAKTATLTGIDWTQPGLEKAGFLRNFF